jgi:hypothetical protein
MGGAYFRVGDAFSDVLGYDDRNLLWGYLMMVVDF